MAEDILFWVLFSRRPLTIRELQQMYALQSISRGVALKNDDLPDGEVLIGVCGSLVVVDSESKIARIVHYTAQEYFERVHHDSQRKTKFDMTKLSLTYLTLPNFADGICVSDDAMATRLEEYPFLDYAARYWGIEGAEVDWDTLSEDLKSFMSSQAAVAVAGQVQSLPEPRHRYANWSQEFPRGVPALTLAASFDIHLVLRRMVSDGHDLEGKGSDGETALVRAASLGIVNNVSTLLDLGASANSTDANGETALHRAAASGKVAVAGILLGGGADVNIKAAAGWTVLMAAVQSGNVDLVRILVEAGTNLAAQTAWGDSSLSIATRRGDQAIAEYLADRGMVLPDTVVGRRASVVASRKGLHELVRRLTLDYRAVAEIGLERQMSFHGDGLATVIECEDSHAGSTGAKPMAFQEPYHLTEILDGIEYTRGLDRRYSLLGTLGKGHFAQVHLCVNTGTGVRYAAKMLEPNNYKRFGLNIRDEIIALRELRQERIMRLVDICVNDRWTG